MLVVIAEDTVAIEEGVVFGGKLVVDGFDYDHEKRADLLNADAKKLMTTSCLPER